MSLILTVFAPIIERSKSTRAARTRRASVLVLVVVISGSGAVLIRIHRHLAQSIYLGVIPRSRSGLHLERQLVSLVAFYQIESATRILSQIDVFVLLVYVFYRQHEREVC